ncbi:HlyD family type I secretion periplasmic adaptor subunit [Oricola thermophila]|uniref:Membrane fusion protein (MFP) family protein n=1 Tax=Oricola thermophila TaxID=2742145 RepID=A0A6N1VER4_9HYPH|nr:HlyD family type I secretion periplasmic adaptor subunit [Oricola thermophila]QKV19178.1 HlyD family type I secretion periplasmic adaptor subunit [Oricola thermophila]
MSLPVAAGDQEWFAEVPRSIRGHVILGIILIVLFFGGFGAWAATAPLAAAVISQGSFVATGNNKIVQHLEGGIIEEILVSEGEKVEKGQPLIRLDETAAFTRERQVFLRRARLEAVVARLRAEQEGAEEVVFPHIITSNLNDPDISEIAEEQRINFQTTGEKLTSDIQLLEHNIDSLEFRIRGYEGLLESSRRQLALLTEEHEGKKQLYDRGFMRAPELKAIERAIAETKGNIERVTAEIDETRSQIDRFEQQIRQTKNAYRQAALDQLQSVAAELDTVREEERTVRNILHRAVIHAPVSGVVVRMHYHSAGGVIESGKPILEILPSNVPLIIECQISQSDIDSVKPGQQAMVRLTALNRRTTPVLYGEVFYVSADSVPDTTGQRYEAYVVRVRLPANELSRIAGFSPTPGMPAEILIQTAERTFLSYLVKPIRDSMSRAFTEK